MGDRDELTALCCFQGATRDDLVDVLDLECLKEEDKLALDLLLVLDHLHIWHLKAVDNLSQDLQDTA